VVSFRPRPLYLRRKPRYLLDPRVSGDVSGKRQIPCQCDCQHRPRYPSSWAHFLTCVAHPPSHTAHNPFTPTPRSQFMRYESFMCLQIQISLFPTILRDNRQFVISKQYRAGAMKGSVMCRPQFCCSQRYFVKQMMDLWVTGTIRSRCLVLTDQFIPPQSTELLDNPVNCLEIPSAGIAWTG
jgi:hypothetical protein